jgi:hypothetical protein
MKHVVKNMVGPKQKASTSSNMRRRTRGTLMSTGMYVIINNNI